MSKLTDRLAVDYLWQPLVYVPHGCRGFLLQPGTFYQPVELSVGWHWHWPALTTIRLVPLNSHTYHIREHVRRSEHDLSDEPVVAATKDLGLVSLEGEITFQLVENSPAILAARISPKSISRTIRPIIRQCFRLAIAEYRKTSLKPSNTLNKQISEMLTDSMADYAIQLHSVSISQIRPFSPVHTPSRRPNTQREGGDAKTLPG